MKPLDSDDGIALPEADKQALEWLIALHDGAADESTTTRFEAWLDAAPENEAAWLQALRLDTALNSASTATPQAIPSASRPRRQLAPTQHRRRLAVGKRTAVAAAMAAAAAVVFVFALPEIRLRLEADYTTNVAETNELVLEDGSTLFLAANSAVDIQFEQSRRLVRLLRGQAYFEVTPDPLRPFQVETADATATVLGTGFDVRIDDGSVEIAVSHGKVGVAGHQQATPPIEPLEAGQWVSITHDGALDRGTMPPQAVASWRSGLVVIEDRPLSEFLGVIRRHYNGQIVGLSDELLQRRITGVYDLTNPSAALEAAVRVLGAKVQEITPWVLLVSAR